MQGRELLSGMNVNSNGDSMMGNEVDARKLVILGLPWETTESSLEMHFSQIGPLQVRRHHYLLTERSCLHIWHQCQLIGWCG